MSILVLGDLYALLLFNLLKVSLLWCWGRLLREVWCAAVHRVTKSQTRLSNWATAATTKATRELDFNPLTGLATCSKVRWHSSVQLLSCVRLFVTPWTAAHQASLSITNSQCVLKLVSILSVMQSNHLILCRPLLPPSIFPTIRVFSNESALHIGGQRIGVSASASVLPMSIQDWFPLGLTGWVSLLSKGFSRVFSNTTVQKHQFFGTQLSL